LGRNGPALASPGGTRYYVSCASFQPVPHFLRELSGFGLRICIEMAVGTQALVGRSQAKHSGGGRRSNMKCLRVNGLGGIR